MVIDIYPVFSNVNEIFKGKWAIIERLYSRALHVHGAIKNKDVSRASAEIIIPHSV